MNKLLKGICLACCTSVALAEPEMLATTESTSEITTPQTSNQSSAISTSCIKRDDEGRFLGWVDNQHCLVSYRATQTAQWLDSLFGQSEDSQDSIGRIRIINDLIWTEGHGLSGKTRIRASAKLPNAKRRFRLVISDEDDKLYPNSNTQTTTQTESTSAAIRWLPNIASRVKYSVDIGAHSTDVFSRLRAQREWTISDNSIFRFRESLRYGLKSELKSVTQGEIERLLNDKTVLRLSSALQYWQNEPDPVGLRWSQDNSILHRISSQKSLAYGLTIEGVQQPSWQVSSDRLFVLYRQSFWRPWLYYELEPQLVRDWTQHKDVTSLLVFRIEANFGN
ncbi:MAG: hypothetical protein H6997_05715 [Moraxellaceae bacterium]|nr:hypothetical protein [Pseudomonadales bacterium]MCP5177041.1 hypothetical protein [Moraxellaceae bacterium]